MCCCVESLQSVLFPNVDILLAIPIIKGFSFKKESALLSNIRNQESRIQELPSVHPFPAGISNGNVRARAHPCEGLGGTEL